MYSLSLHYPVIIMIIIIMVVVIIIITNIMFTYIYVYAGFSRDVSIDDLITTVTIQYIRTYVPVMFRYACPYPTNLLLRRDNKRAAFALCAGTS